MYFNLYLTNGINPDLTEFILLIQTYDLDFDSISFFSVTDLSQYSTSRILMWIISCSCLFIADVKPSCVRKRVNEN